MDDATKKQLNALLKASSTTDTFLNDDHLCSGVGDKSTRQMVIDMIVTGLEKTGWRIVLQKI